MSSIFAAVGRILSAQALAEQIRDVSECIQNVYSDIADAQFQTAQQAFQAASHSKSPEREIANGINSLRSAYNIYTKLIGKTRKERYLLFFTNETPYIKEPKEFYRQMTRIASIIFWAYRGLGEDDNALPWQRNAVANFEHFLEGCHPDPLDLKAVSEDYVREEVEEVEKSRQWMGDGVPDLVDYDYVTVYVITGAGEEYVEQRKAELLEEFPQLLYEHELDLHFEPGQEGLT